MVVPHTKDLCRSLQCRGEAQDSRMPAGRSADGGSYKVVVPRARPLRSGLRVLLAWGALVLLSGRGGAEACPTLCRCLGNTVDCHGLGMHSVPRNIPRGTERL